MAKPSPTYRGDAPYVFVCYAHANMDDVYDEIAWLQACGLNVWYDEGISAGAEWREELGEAIRDCHLFLFFVSPEATESENCRRELNFALDHERPTLAVYLSETEMSPGLYLSLADRQAILRYAEADADYRKKLLDTVSRALGAEVPAATVPAHRTRRRTAGRWRQMAGAAAIALIVAGLGWYLGRTGVQQAGQSLTQLTRFQIEMDGLGGVAVAPDGSSVAYSEGESVLVRELDELEARAVPGGADPLYSPDGKWIVYRQALEGRFMRVPVEGGAPSPIIETSPVPPLGASWLDDHTLVYADDEGLHRGSVTDGATTLLLKPDPSHGERFFAWPCALPDGHTVLFTVLPNTEDRAHIAALDLESGARTVVLRGATSARVVPTGHLVYFDDAHRALMGVRFDVSTLTPQGDPVRVIASEIWTHRGGAKFDLSSNGTLAYVAWLASNHPLGTTLVWVDREGKEDPTSAPQAMWINSRLSPDAHAVAGDINTIPPPTFRSRRDIYVWNFERRDMTRLTDKPTEDILPVWSQDGRTVFFASNRNGLYNVYSVPADGATPPERVLDTPHPSYPTALSADGRLITMFNQPGEPFDIGAITLVPPVRHEPLLSAPANQTNGVVSPDGRWLAYQSNVSGQGEVYVRALADPAGHRWKVSATGGSSPRWSPHTEEIYYVSADGDMMSAAFRVASEFKVEAPVKLFAGSGYALGGGGATSYDVSAVDGRFLVRKVPSDAVKPAEVHVVLNWFQELERLLPN